MRFIAQNWSPPVCKNVSANSSETNKRKDIRSRKCWPNTIVDFLKSAPNHDIHSRLARANWILGVSVYAMPWCGLALIVVSARSGFAMRRIKVFRSPSKCAAFYWPKASIWFDCLTWIYALSTDDHEFVAEISFSQSSRHLRRPHGQLITLIKAN